MSLSEYTISRPVPSICHVKAIYTGTMPPGKDCRFSEVQYKYTASDRFQF